MNDITRLTEAARRAIGTALVRNQVDALTRLLEALHGPVPDRVEFARAAGDLFLAECGELHGLAFAAVGLDPEKFDGFEWDDHEHEQSAVKWLAEQWGVADAA